MAPVARVFSVLLCPAVLALHAPHARRRRICRAASLEEQLVDGAAPLEAVDVSAVAAAVRRDGVARVAGPVLPHAAAAALRARILAEVANPQRWAAEDMRVVFGTRLRFDECVELRFDDDTRSDVLLPLEDPLVRGALDLVAEQLREMWVEASACLPGDGALELVECSALINWPGSGHQPAHADFSRIDDEDDDDPDDMPPRLVTFVYLQDTPSLSHGPTAFLLKSATEAAHRLNEFEEEALVGEFACGLATVDCGHAVVYDASVLHFGAANNVPGNDRVVLYITFARADAAMASAAARADPDFAAMTAVAPIPLASL